MRGQRFYVDGTLTKIRELTLLREYYRQLAIDDGGPNSLRAFRAANRLNLEIGQWFKKYNARFMAWRVSCEVR